MVDIAKLATFVQSSPLPSWLATSKGDCVYANPALERLTGLDSNQINQADWPSFLPEEDRAAATASWQSSVAIGAPYRARVRMRGFDGVPATVELIAFGQQVVDGRELWLFAGLPVDSATQQQPQFEAQLQSTLNVIPAYTWYAAPSGALTFVNERTADYLGLPKDHPLRLGIDIGGEWDSHIPLLHPDDREESRRIWSICLQTGSARESSIRIRNAEGGYRWFQTQVEPLRASDGTLLYWVGVNLDIDDAKRAEDAIRKSEKELREVVDSIPALIHTARPDGYIDYFNKGWLEYFGVTLDEVAGWNWTAVVHAEDVEGILTRWQACLVTGEIFEYETRVRGANGEYRWMFHRKVPLRDANGNIVKWYGSSMDIHERKTAEEALRSSEAYLEEAQRLTHMGSWAWTVADRSAVHLSEEWYRIYGFNPAEGAPDWERRLERVHPEDRLKWNGTLDRAILEKADYDVEFRIVLPDGTLKWVHTVGHPALDAVGELVEFAGSSMDITERKQAEQKLQAQEAELRQILDLVPQMVAVFGPGGERLYANRIWLDYIGPSLEEWLQTPGNFFSSPCFHPDDQERAARTYSDRARSGGSAYELELRPRKRDGSYRWFLARFNPLRDEHGQIMRWYVAMTDIEDRKRAEERLRQECAALREEIDETSMFEEIVGTSSALRTVLSRISKVAPSDSTVLISGETGTGKELIARAVHKRSKRSGRAFVSMNCAALAPTLISSELFGHEKGSFTGATQLRVGRFELADGGTLFLDEVGELLPDTQAALLRVLQEREFERVGGGQPIRVDVRVIAATNRDLTAAVANGTFRQDLFYRLNVFPIEVPPLRDRKADILMLVEYFVQRYAVKAGKNIRSVDKKTLDLLRSYDWPGNIRELQNVIERSVILSSGDVFSVDELWLSKETSRPASRVGASALFSGKVEQRSEREIIEAALAATRGRVSGPSGAAIKLGIPPSTLETRIKALKINKSQFKFR